MNKLKNIKKWNVLNFGWDTFSKYLKKLILFTSKTTIVPINADRWEELIYVTLKHMGKNPRWNLGSHAPGADIWIDEFAISAKSGNIQKNYLIISSYRLTRFNNLNEMISFIDGSEGKNYDVYLCCARKDLKNGNRIYKVFLIDADTFKASELKWEEMFPKKGGSPSGWRGTNRNGIKVEIRKKMSNQLWISLPINLCDEILHIEIKKNELGSDAEKPLLEESD